MQASVAPGTLAAYQHHWDQYNNFLHNTLNKQASASNPQDVLLFATHLHTQGKMPSTITTYLSAISFYYKLQDVPDPTSTFVCEKFLCGLKKFSAPSNQLQPVTIHILNALLMANHSHNPSSYTQVLLASVMTLMYFGCLRIGEVAIS